MVLKVHCLRLILFSIAFRCCLRYWLGFYCTFQQQLRVSQPMSSFSSNEPTMTYEWYNQPLIDRPGNWPPTHPPPLHSPGVCMVFGFVQFFAVAFVGQYVFQQQQSDIINLLQLTEGRPPGQRRHRAKQRPAKKKVLKVHCRSNQLFYQSLKRRHRQCRPVAQRASLRSMSQDTSSI